MARFAASLLILLVCSISKADPDWSRGAAIPERGRANPFELTESELALAVRAGRLHALHYPVNVTGVLLPYEPLRRFLTAESGSPSRRLMQKIFGAVVDMKTYDDAEAWLGLQKYPTGEGSGPYFVPFANGQRPEHRMGFTVMETPIGKGVTISCAECHASNLFGKRVIGLTNRFPRANRAFVLGRFGTQRVGPNLFAWATEANAEEKQLYARSRESLRFIGAIKPLQLGLDTSLAHVALSLAKRRKDPWASKDPLASARPEPLSRFHADSKPAVWWNVKYKNRWLSDGSVVSGNPIYTNILWNEIGRGTDLRELSDWLDSNSDVISELTTAVFNAEAPLWTDFFPAETIELELAKRGQKLFNNACAKCHGTYEKAWDLADADALPLSAKLRTIQVKYKPVKPVIDVGTDPQRFQGMKSLVQLNDLEISKRNNIVIEAQQGYVPPPLVGIWARWPYFHNNSVPTLCAVLTPADKRPQTYWAREANDPSVDFDSNCNGYPATKPTFSDREKFYDTRRAGMRNTGHDEKILVKDGREVFSPEEKIAIIRFLQTL